MNTKVIFIIWLNHIKIIKTSAITKKKEINNKYREEYLKNEKIPEFPFKPKTNKAGAINYIKMNKDLNFDNNKSKAKKANYYKEKLDQFPFKPEINHPDLKKNFENSLFTNHLSLINRPKKFWILAII